MSAPTRGPASEPAPAVSVWNLPNALTVLRLLLVPVVGWLLLREGGQDPLWRTLAFTAFVVAAITDTFDGEIARRRNLITDFGKIADPIADKALLGTSMVLLSVLGEVPWWATVIVVVREVGVTLLRFWVIRYGVISASPGGKVKTTLQMITLGGYLLPLVDWLGSWVSVVLMVLLVATVLITVATGVDYVVRAVRLRRAAGA